MIISQSYEIYKRLLHFMSKAKLTLPYLAITEFADLPSDITEIILYQISCKLCKPNKILKNGLQ